MTSENPAEYEKCDEYDWYAETARRLADEEPHARTHYETVATYWKEQAKRVRKDRKGA